MTLFRVCLVLKFGTKIQQFLGICKFFDKKTERRRHNRHRKRRRQKCHRKEQRRERRRDADWQSAQWKNKNRTNKRKDAGWQPAQRKNLNGGKNATERNNPHTMRDNRRNGQTKRNGLKRGREVTGYGLRAGIRVFCGRRRGRSRCGA